MTRRTSRSTVTFTKPFRLSALDEVLSAGTYAVESEEELVDGLSFVAYRRVSTVMLVPGGPGGPVQMQVVPVDPTELEAALQADAESR